MENRQGKRPKIVIVGSINMDLVTETGRFPQAGETVLGERFSFFPGGKGANQAVACARLGADVTMIGCVGDDPFGADLLQHLKNEGVSTAHVETVSSVATGIATILVENGENRIIVVSGANQAVTPEKVRKAESEIRAADLLLAQLEIPMDSVREAIRLASRHGVPVILNPAPATKLTEEDIRNISVLTPNEHELGIVFGEESKEEKLKEWLYSYPGKIVMTKGSEGAFYVDEKGTLRQQPAVPVDAIDTTGAGDAFNGAFAVMLGRGKKLSEAVRFAVAAASRSVTQKGAQSGMPTEDEVIEFMRVHASQEQSPE